MRRWIRNATDRSSRGASGRKGLEVLGLTLMAMACLSVPGYAQDELETVVCVSQDGEREECPADTAGGVVLLEST